MLYRARIGTSFKRQLSRGIASAERSRFSRMRQLATVTAVGCFSATRHSFNCVNQQQHYHCNMFSQVNLFVATLTLMRSRVSCLQRRIPRQAQSCYKVWLLSVLCQLRNAANPLRISLRVLGFVFCSHPCPLQKQSHIAQLWHCGRNKMHEHSRPIPRQLHCGAETSWWIQA